MVGYEIIGKKQEGKNTLYSTDNSDTNAFYIDLETLKTKRGTVKDSKIALVKSNGQTTDTVNYIIETQPYSTYGVLYADTSIQKSFAVGREAGDGTEQGTYTVAEQTSSGIKWKDTVKGDATYKGNVIGITQGSEPSLDGTVTLNAHFADGRNNSYLSGTIESKTFGTISLPKTTITDGGMKNEKRTAIAEFESAARAVTATKEGKEYLGEYMGSFLGKDLNDVVGGLELKATDGSGGYNASFGGTKQK